MDSLLTIDERQAVLHTDGWSGMVYAQDAKTRREVMKLMMGQAIILSGPEGTGVVMFSLEDWTALKEEVKGDSE